MEMARKEQKGLAKAAVFIMAMIFVSRIIGFIREAIMAKSFGRGAATDAFIAAFTIPDMMYYLLIGGALSSAFIPVFTEYLAKGKEKDGWEAASTFINVAVLLLVALTILGVIFAPLLAPLVAYQFKGNQLQLLVRLMRLMFPAVFCTALAGLQMGILNSYRDFLAPTLGPIVYNIGIILGAVLLGGKYGVTGMAVGVIAGAFGNVLTQMSRVISVNRGYKLIIDLNNEGYRRMIRLMAPTVIGLSITQLNLVVNQNLASGLPHGSITALRYANRIMQLPLGIFAAGLAQAIFPTLTRQVAVGDMAGYRSTLNLGIRTIFYITLPAAVGLAVLRVPIVQLAFEHGAFTHKDTLATAGALAFYSIGLVAASTIQVLTRGFYSLHDTSTTVKTGISMVVLNFLMNLGFIHYTKLAHRGLALAFSIDGTINMVLLLYFLGKKVRGIGAARLFHSFMKSLVSAGVMGAAVYLAHREATGFIHGSEEITIAARLGLSTFTGVITYFGISRLLKMEEADYILNMIRKRRKG